MSAPDPITVCLVGCGKAKATKAAPARDLYTGSLFRASRRFAETCDEWRIISARYAIVHPDTKLAPYDQRIRRDGLELRQFALVCANDLCHEFRGLKWEAVILAGSDYAEPLAAVLRERGINVRLPLAGLGIGHRLQWLSRNVQAEVQP